MSGQWFAESPALYFGGVTLADRLNSWFEATGRKKNSVAKRGGIKPSQISEIIGDEPSDPRFSTVEKIAAGFGVTVEEFFIGPRPEKDARHGDDRPREGSAVLERLRLEQLEAEAPAEDSARGDILRAQHALASAQAALNRALRRADKKSGAA